MLTNPLYPLLREALDAYKANPSPYTWGRLVGLQYARGAWDDPDLTPTDIAATIKSLPPHGRSRLYQEGLHSVADSVQRLPKSVN